MEHYALWALSIIASLFLGGFLKSYMGKKGENLATKEDIEVLVEKVRRESQAMKEAEIVAIQNKLDTVVAQNQAIVRSSEEIKDQISSRQRTWELKREAAYDIMKLLATFSHVLASATGLSGSADNQSKQDAMMDTSRRHNECTESLWQLKGIAYLLFEKDLAELLGQTSAEGTQLMRMAMSGLPTDALMKQMVIFQGLHDRMTATLQKELTKG